MKKCRKNYNRTSSNKETYRKDHGQWGKQFSSIGPKGSNSRTYSQIEVKLDSCRNEIKVVMKEAFHKRNLMVIQEEEEWCNYKKIQMQHDFIKVTIIMIIICSHLYHHFYNHHNHFYSQLKILLITTFLTNINITKIVKLPFAFDYQIVNRSLLINEGNKQLCVNEFFLKL